MQNTIRCPDTGIRGLMCKTIFYRIKKKKNMEEGSLKFNGLCADDVDDDITLN